MILDDNDGFLDPEGGEAAEDKSSEINEVLTKVITVVDRTSGTSDRAAPPDLANLHVGTNIENNQQIQDISGSDELGQFAQSASQRNAEAERSDPDKETEPQRVAPASPTPVPSSHSDNRVAASGEPQVEIGDGSNILSSDRDIALEGPIGASGDLQTASNSAAIPTRPAVVLFSTNAQADPGTEIQGPEARDDHGSIAENSVAAFDVLANDVAPVARGGLHLSSASIVSGQGAIRIIDGQLLYDPEAAYNHLADGEQAQVTISYGIVNDAGDHDSATLDLTIIGGNDAPTVQRALADQAALEDSAVSFTVPNDTFRDVDGNDALTYSATLADGGILPAWLRFDADTRTFSGTPDNADIGDLRVNVTATDSHGIEVSDSFSLAVGNVNDAPDDLTLDGGSVIENAVAGTVVGTATAHDSDVGDSLTYALVDDADGRFAIDSTTGQIIVADPSRLDFETAVSHGVGIRVTDQSGASYDQAFTINVVDAVESLTGTQGNDTLIGGAGADVMSGLGGADSIDGGAGADTLEGGRGKDSLIGADGDDILDGGSSNDTLFGGAGDDTLMGGNASGSGKNTEIGGNDTLHGGGGFDTLYGGDGADSLFGGADNDTLDGGLGNDRLDGGAGADIIDGGAGRDQVIYQDSDQAVHIDLSLGTASGGHAEGDVIRNIEQVVGSAHDDTLVGNSGSNTLSGGDGDDVIIGGQGDDTIYGGGGDDHLNGGQGDDILYGGDGADHFLLMMAQGNDAVSGGDGGWVDVVELQDEGGGSNIGDFGADWTVAIESGAIEGSGTSTGPNGESHGWLDLVEDTSGTIIMQDGTEFTFDGIEHIIW